MMERQNHGEGRTRKRWKQNLYTPGLKMVITVGEEKEQKRNSEKKALKFPLKGINLLDQWGGESLVDEEVPRAKNLSSIPRNGSHETETGKTRNPAWEGEGWTDCKRFKSVLFHWARRWSEPVLAMLHWRRGSCGKRATDEWGAQVLFGYMCSKRFLPMTEAELTSLSSNKGKKRMGEKGRTRQACGTLNRRKKMRCLRIIAKTRKVGGSLGKTRFKNSIRSKGVNNSIHRIRRKKQLRKKTVRKDGKAKPEKERNRKARFPRLLRPIPR